MSNRKPRHRRARGLTLLELLIAVVITTIAGMALSSVMITTARSITGTSGSRSALQRAHVAYIRLRAFTDPGLCLLQDEPGQGFALWLEDTKPGDTVNLREMRAFWFNPGTGLLTVERVEFPPEWPPEMQDAFDIPLGSGSDFLAEMQVQRALGYTKTETLADGLLDLSLTHDGMTPQQARRLWLTFTINDASEQPPEVLTAYAFLTHEEPL